MNQVPSLGRTVHYVLDEGPNEGEHRTATITYVPEGDSWDIFINYNPIAADKIYRGRDLLIIDSKEHVPYDEDGLPGTWHWPEFVPPAERKDVPPVVESPA